MMGNAGCSGAPGTTNIEIVFSRPASPGHQPTAQGILLDGRKTPAIQVARLLDVLTVRSAEYHTAEYGIAPLES
jgi:hypothetical protein